MKKNKRVRQGQAAWQLVMFPPNAIDGHAGEVAMVYQCRVIKVWQTGIKYRIGSQEFIATHEAWALNYPSFRRAMREAMARIEAIDRAKLSEYQKAWYWDNVQTETPQ